MLSRPVRPSDFAEVAEVLTRTLGADAGFLELVPMRANRDLVLRAFFDAYVRTYSGPHHRLDVSVDEEGSIAAVAAWALRGANGSGGSVVSELALAPQYFRALGVGGLLTPWRVRRLIERRRPPTTHWWLASVAVLASHRDRGVGSALVRHGLDAFDDDRQDSYVESTSGAATRFFTRLGFRASGSTGDARTVQPMHRPYAGARRRHDGP